MKPHHYLATQYFWVLILLLLISLGLLTPTTRRCGIIHSATKESTWDYDPELFLNFADTHLNTRFPERAKNFEKALNNSLKWNPKLIIITGDLVDNKPTELGYPKQSTDDYKMYRSVIDKFNIDDKLIDIAGNHDEYRLYSYDSKQHYFLKYNNYMNTFNLGKDDFYISTYETENTQIVSIQPFRYPTLNAKYGFFIYPTKNILNIIEKALEKTTNKTRIIQTHYPLNLWGKMQKSSNGNTLSDIVLKSNTSMLITAHIHPESFSVLHTKEMIEIVVSDMKVHKNYALISNDNGRLSFHQNKLGDEPDAILTYPIIKSQLSSQTVFNQPETPIRVVVFNPMVKSIQYSIDNNETTSSLKFLKYLDENKSIALYSSVIEANLSEGVHKIKFKGDWTYETEFVIGSKVDLNITEKIFGIRNVINTLLIGGTILLIFLIIIAFPIEFSYGNKINKNIFDDNNTQNICNSLLLGFLAINSRINKNPKWITIPLFISLLYPIILPTFFVEVEGHVGVLWSYGSLLKGKENYDVFGPILSSIYVFTVSLPSTLFASMLGSPIVWSNCFIIDIILYLIFIGIICFVSYYFFREIVNVWGCFTSLCFSIIPIAFIILFITRFIQKIKARNYKPIITFSSFHDFQD